MTEQTIMSDDFLDISTHTLTWSVTTSVKYRKTDFVISTHTLTWSVTEKRKSNDT